MIDIPDLTMLKLGSLGWDDGNASSSRYGMNSWSRVESGRLFSKHTIIAGSSSCCSGVTGALLSPPPWDTPKLISSSWGLSGSIFSIRCWSEERPVAIWPNPDYPFSIIMKLIKYYHYYYSNGCIYIFLRNNHTNTDFCWVFFRFDEE